ncbi:MAG TPA: FtsX-like permease family protein [Micromonosporaceae bacterium]|nr:FtsX-like permease family protein [Micromonosporaceae bacterium]
MMGGLRRVWAYGGHFTLLAALAMVAALLLTATPRIANQLSDADLHADLSGLHWQARDINFHIHPTPSSIGVFGPPSRARDLKGRYQAMPPQLRRLVGERWYAAETALGRLLPAEPERLPTAPLIQFNIRTVTGGQEAIRLIDGHWPRQEIAVGAPIQVVVSAATAEELDLRVGTRWRLSLSANNYLRPDSEEREVQVVGVFEPLDPHAEIWDPSPLVLEPHAPLQDGEPYLVTALAGEEAMAAINESLWPIAFSLRYRIHPERIKVDQAERTLDALKQVRRLASQEVTVLTGLDHQLRDFVDSLRTVRALLAIVVAGLLAALCGLILLAARLTAETRRAEFALLQARGGSLTTIAGRSLVEALLVVPLGAAVGWAAGTAIPGRSAETGWLVVFAAVGIAFALPAVVLTSRPSLSDRRDLVSDRTSLRRRTVEISVLVVAVLGAFLLHRRGLPSYGAVDPLLVSVPVLLAAAAAVLARRAYPGPLRLLGRLTARARGTVGFLAMARAGRAAAATGPLLVLVVAVATAALSAALSATVAEGRDRAAALAVPADALLTGERFAADTVNELVALPKVRAVAPIVVGRNERLYPDADGTRAELDSVLVLVVDGPELTKVADRSGAEIELPPALTGSGAGDGPVPAVVSPEIADRMRESAFISYEGERYELRAAAVVEHFPAIDRNTRRFVVLPRQALQESLAPTGFLIAGADLDASTLREVGDRSQRRWLDENNLIFRKTGASTVTLRADHRAGLERGNHNGLMGFVFQTGAVGGALLGLLAVALAVLAGARTRARVLSRLRTMGLSRRQWRGLMICELMPLVGVAVLTGATVGLLLPVLLLPVLNLSAFTGGVPLPVRFAPGVAAGVIALAVVALGTAVAVEAMINRRLRLGEVLRLGEES